MDLSFIPPTIRRAVLEAKGEAQWVDETRTPCGGGACTTGDQTCIARLRILVSNPPHFISPFNPRNRDRDRHSNPLECCCCWRTHPLPLFLASATSLRTCNMRQRAQSKSIEIFAFPAYQPSLDFRHKGDLVQKSFLFFQITHASHARYQRETLLHKEKAMKGCALAQ